MKKNVTNNLIIKVGSNSSGTESTGTKSAGTKAADVRMFRRGQPGPAGVPGLMQPQATAQHRPRHPHPTTNTKPNQNPCKRSVNPNQNSEKPRTKEKPYQTIGIQTDESCDFRINFFCTSGLYNPLNRFMRIF